MKRHGVVIMIGVVLVAVGLWPQMRAAAQAVATVIKVEVLSGEVSLSTKTQNALAAPVCRFGNPTVLNVTGTAVPVPTTLLATRTQLTIRNLSSNHTLRCRVENNPGERPQTTTPGIAWAIPPGVTDSFTVDGSKNVYCLSQTGNSDVTTLEAECAQPE